MATNGTLPPWFPMLETVVSYSFMVFVILTIPLYSMVVFIMFLLRRRAYHGMFYKIFMVGAVIDIVALTNNYLGAIFPAKGWFVEFYTGQGTGYEKMWTGHLYLILAWGTRFSQGMTVTLLALNRATAVCSPMKHKQIWRSSWANGVFVVQIGMGIYGACCLLNQHFHWKNQDGGYYVQFADLQFRAWFFTMAYAFDTVIVLVIIVTNITMLFVFRRKYRTRSLIAASTANQKVLSEKQRQENNLCIISGVTCVIELTYYFYIIYTFAINPYTNTKVFYLIYNALNDLYGGIGAWLIIGLSRTLRNHIKAILFCCVRNKKPIIGASSVKIPLSSMTGLTGHAPRTPTKRKLTICPRK